MLIKIHVSTPWGHLQAYKIWYYTRYRPTLYDTIFYNPEDDPKGLKHVSLLIIVALLNFAPHCCVKVNVPLEVRSGPEGSRKLRFPDFVTMAQDGGKVVSITHRLALPPGNTPGTHFS